VSQKTDNSVTRIVSTICAKNYQKFSKYVKVMAKILSVPSIWGHGILSLLLRSQKHIHPYYFNVYMHIQFSAFVFNLVLYVIII